jgi:hypothetical protein
MKKRGGGRERWSVILVGGRGRNELHRLAHVISVLQRTEVLLP